MCPLVPSDQLAGPTYGSIGIAGAPKTGKTYSLRTLRLFLLKKKLCPRIAIFDLDDDGADTLISLANVEGWNTPEYLEVYRYNEKGRPIKQGQDAERSQIPTETFISDAAKLYDRLDPKTGKWLPGQELGAVVVDSMTALNERWVEFVGAVGHKTTGDFTWTEWRRTRDKILETVKSFKGLPCYSVFMFHEVLIQEEVPGPDPKAPAKTTGNMLWVPKIQGDLNVTIQKEFSVFVHSKVEGGDKYKWITQPTDRIRAIGSRNKTSMPKEVTQDFENIL